MSNLWKFGTMLRHESIKYIEIMVMFCAILRWYMTTSKSLQLYF